MVGRRGCWTAFASVSLYFSIFLSPLCLVLWILIESVIWASSSETKKEVTLDETKREIAVCVVLLGCAHTHTQVLSAGVLRSEVSLTLVAP